MSGSLAGRYDALLVDLDGVVYRGETAVPSAIGTFETIRSLGTTLLFLTNNSARTPAQVVANLRAMGIRCDETEVMTSALATAALLGESSRGQTAYVIGEQGIREALQQAGVRVVDGEPARADLVVVGWDRSADYSKLRTASLLVERGARLVATNGDASYPAPDGLWPGAGAILAAVTTTTGVQPTVVGKPNRPMFQAAQVAAGATRPLVVGDRLDTDIAGAAAMGWDSLLVLSGATRPSDLASGETLPTYVAPDVSGLLVDLPAVGFRRAQQGDLPGVRDLLEEAGLRSEGLEQRLGDTLVGTVRPDPQGASSHPDQPSVPLAPVATACLEPVNGFGILRSVAVAKKAQGVGLGMLTVASVLREARSLGLRTTYLFTETATGFFERMGFVPLDRTTLPEAVRSSRQALEECAASAIAMAHDQGPVTTPS